MRQVGRYRRRGPRKEKKTWKVPIKKTSKRGKKEGMNEEKRRGLRGARGHMKGRKKT